MRMGGPVPQFRRVAAICRSQSAEGSFLWPIEICEATAICPSEALQPDCGGCNLLTGEAVSGEQAVVAWAARCRAVASGLAGERPARAGTADGTAVQAGSDQQILVETRADAELRQATVSTAPPVHRVAPDAQRRFFLRRRVMIPATMSRTGRIRPHINQPCITDVLPVASEQVLSVAVRVRARLIPTGWVWRKSVSDAWLAAWHLPRLASLRCPSTTRRYCRRSRISGTPRAIVADLADLARL